MDATQPGPVLKQDHRQGEVARDPSGVSPPAALVPVGFSVQLQSALVPYLKIARADHWFKNVFMLPGIGIAAILEPLPLGTVVPLIVVGVLSTCLAASANYTINEYLDAEFDRLHPLKCHRPCALGLVNPKILVIEYILLAVTSLALASAINGLFLSMTVLLLILGLMYNVPPIRTKDVPVLDVFTESLNNPVRFVLGWSIVLGTAFPPTSILLTYWFGGAFLMSVKRYAEFREIGRQTADLYRKAFQRYSENKLLLLSLFCALNSAFFLAIFLIKYRIELLLTFPFFALLFTWYLRIGLKKGSSAQRPEKLYRERLFVLYVTFLVLLTITMFKVDLPWLRIFLEKSVY